MFGDRPLSFVLKPPEPKVCEIDDRRRFLGIEDSYGSERFHLTFVPLGDGRNVPAAFVDLLDRAVRLAELEPFRVELARLNGNAMIVGKGAADMCRVQQRLVRHLTAIGLALPDYTLRPHLSLVYGERSRRTARFPPIAWQVERLLLIRSMHGQGRHEPLGEWPLVPRQGSLPF